MRMLVDWQRPQHHLLPTLVTLQPDSMTLPEWSSCSHHLPLVRRQVAEIPKQPSWVCLHYHDVRIYFIYLYIIKWVGSYRKMMEFAQSYWSQCDIIKMVTILNKRGTDTVHSVIIIKCQKYPSIIILKHYILWIKWIDPLRGAYTILRTLAEISHKQKD